MAFNFKFSNAKKTTLIIYVVIAIFLVESIAIAFLVIPRKENSSSQISQALPANNNEIAGIEIYKNDKYGFEFQYPKDYFGNLSTEEKETEYLYYGKAVDLFKTDSFSTGHGPSLLVMFSQLDHDSLVEKLNSGLPFGKISMEEKNINGKSAYFYDSGSSDGKRLCSAKNLFAYNEKTKGYLHLTFTRCETVVSSGEETDKLSAGYSALREADKKVFDQIVSSLKFIK
jgi:hypothetical protein